MMVMHDNSATNVYVSTHNHSPMMAMHGNSGANVSRDPGASTSTCMLIAQLGNSAGRDTTGKGYGNVL